MIRSEHAIASHPTRARRSLVRAPWLFLALTLPLFAFDFLRYDSDILNFKIAVPLIVIGGIAGLGCIAFLARGGGIRIYSRNEVYGGPLALLIYMFLIWHMISALTMDSSSLAMREIIKLSIGIISFFVIVAFFPRDNKFLERFWVLTIWSSAAMMGLMIYEYAIVFQLSYMGSQFDIPSAVGRNQMTWYLTFILPYSVAFLWSRKFKLFPWLPALVLTSSWIYAGSRGSWVAVAIGLVALSTIIGRGTFLRRVSGMLIFYSMVILTGLICWWTLTGYLDVTPLDSARRLLSLYDPAMAPEIRSGNTRIDLARATIASFTSSPILGVGLMSTRESIGLSHNDYLGILSDLGLIGGVLFGGILSVVAVKLFGIRSDVNARHGSWVFYGTISAFVAITVSLMFINGYTSVIFWVFIGLCLVTVDVERLGSRTKH